jgi:hypothetical protein
MTQPLRTYRKSTDKEANEMASSNDIEVLDPTATVEKLKNIVSKVALNRRHFMAALGVAGIAAGTRLGSGPVAHAQQPTPTGFAQADVLNYLLNIKYLKATFYSYVTQGVDLPSTSYVTLSSGQVYNQPTAKITFTGTNAAQITDMFNEMYYDELNQLIDLRNFLGVAAAPRATMNLLGNSVPSPAAYATPSGTVITTGAQAIGQARMLEDVSVTAFAGALSYLTGTNLAIAAQILATDGCHAAALRLASIQTGAAYQGTLYQSTFQIATTALSPTVYAVLPSSAAVVGDIITAPGFIPPGAVITAITPKANAVPTGIVTSGSKSITAVSSTSGILVGQPITGTGVPALTYVATVGTTAPYTLTISAAVTATPAAVAPTGYITNGTNSITGVSSISGLTVGQPITLSSTAVTTGQVIGTIPANTVILTASGTTITMGSTTGSPVNATATSQISFIGIVTNGSTTITPVSNVAGLATGQPITAASGDIPTATPTTITTIGANITMSAKATASSPFSTQTSFNGIVTSGSANITLVSSIAGLAVGQPLTGPGIPVGTTIKSAPSGTTVVMSANATASSTVTPSGTVTSGSKIITNVTSLTGVIVGQPITGAGIPTSPATTISSIGTTSPYSITMSAAATATPAPITFTGITTTGSPTITNVWGVGASGTVIMTGLSAGGAVNQPLTGVGIPTGATIASWGTVYPYSITMNQPATATLTPVSFTAVTTSGSPILTDVASITGLAAGQPITGTGIPANTVISSIVSTAPYSITMATATGAASNATVTEPTLTTITTAEFITFPAPEVVTTPALQPVISGGEVLTSPTISTVNSPSTETLTIGQGSITISEAAIATGSATATIATPDPDEVVPVDPGTAALAAAGPVLDTSSSPAVYQGFFATAGAKNATGATPAGFAYARTFSQVLSVLYGSTITSPPTTYGGFYPESLNGNINANGM